MPLLSIAMEYGIEQLVKVRKIFFIFFVYLVIFEIINIGLKTPALTFFSNVITFLYRLMVVHAKVKM